MNLDLTIAQLAKKHNIKPLKKYGQNFIFDLSLCNKIVRASKLPEGANVLEIGPGTAGLTRAILLANPHKLTVIETDKRFIPLLEEIKVVYSNLDIIIADALNFDVTSLNHRNIHIISNLPYNIGTELLIGWLKQSEKIGSITVMLQKEVVERITAQAGSKTYGRLSIICNIMCHVEKCFDVSRDVFYPSPRVQSAVVRLIPKNDTPPKEMVAILEKITSHAFNQRRKMLKLSLKGLSLENAMNKLGIDPTLRAENLTPEQYLSFANFITKFK